MTGQTWALLGHTEATLGRPRFDWGAATDREARRPLGAEGMLFIDGAPNRLAVFLIDSETGAPLGLRPIMAEIVVPYAPPSVSNAYYDLIRRPIDNVDGALSAQERQRVIASVMDALARVLAESSQEDLVNDVERLWELLESSLKRVTEKTGLRLGDTPAYLLTTELTGAMRELAGEMGIQTRPAVDTTARWSNPLGILTTDRAGYVSFDLTRLRPDARNLLMSAIEMRRSDPAADPGARIYIQPLGQPPVDILADARFGADVIVGLVRAAAAAVPRRAGGGQALQNPSLTDWLMSPGSFASNPAALVGDDGCEQIYPATLALQEFVIRQVVRLTDSDDFEDIPEEFEPAYVDEYLVTWSSLGHSLGEVLYSLTLAPGETVRLAAIDWSWDSATSREEQASETEELRHQTHRDRTISETVKAALKEHQSGSSVMGGMAHSLGASGSANLGILGLGAASGDTNSIGGATATTNGSRDLAAENVQRLSDSFAQASSSQRELNSTVVVQAHQAEKETIQTRTFTNYNHAHTLTVLYHEVLRHFRVTTKWIRRRRAILVPRSPFAWDDASIRQHRTVLERALLDSAAAPGFDALSQLLVVETDDQNNPQPVPPVISQPRDWKFSTFVVTCRVDQETIDDGATFHIEAHLTNDDTIRLLEGNNENLNATGRFTESPRTFSFVVAPESDVVWKNLKGFDFFVKDDDDQYLKLLNVGIFGVTQDFGSFKLVDFDTAGQLDISRVHTRYFRDAFGPNPDIPQPPDPPTGRKRLTLEQNGAIARLTEHLQAFPEYYDALRYFGRPSVEVAKELAGLIWDASSKVLDHVDPVPLEVFGKYVAYPLVGGGSSNDALAIEIAAALDGTDPTRKQWALSTLATLNEADQAETVKRLALAASRAERLITLPTRGVFAEGELGHCNVAEEIDNTRFWKWEEHPLPIEAPEIAATTPTTPQPQQADVSPSPFPQSLVNIVNPTAAPDPSGLSAALQLLGTANIFRDMSGQAQVADLLKKLSDNTIAIAEAANHAREIGQGGGGAKNGGPAQPPGAAEPTGDVTPAQNQSAGAQSMPASQTPDGVAARKEADAQAAKAEQETDRAKLKDAADFMSPDDRKKVNKATAEKWTAKQKTIDFQLNFRTSITNTNVDGEFIAYVDGPGNLYESLELYTSNGTVKASIPKWPAGEYAIQVTGHRTKLPPMLGANLTVKSLGDGLDDFTVSLNKYIDLTGLPLAGTGKFRIESNTTSVVLSVTAVEAQSTVTKEVSFDKDSGVEVGAEIGLKAGLKDLEIATFGANGNSSWTDKAGNKISVSLPYTYLTGGLRVE